MTELTPDNAPTGTVAKSTLGGYWIKTRGGWQASGRGSTFPLPGSGWDGELHLPGSPVAQAAEEEREVEAWVGVERAAAELYLSKEWRHYDLGKLTREEAVAIIVSAWTERGRRAREMWMAHGMSPSIKPTMTVSPQPNDPQQVQDLTTLERAAQFLREHRLIQIAWEVDAVRERVAKLPYPDGVDSVADPLAALVGKSEELGLYDADFEPHKAALRRIADMDPEGKRADDLGRAARIARDALGVAACPKFGSCKAVGDHGYDIPNVLCADFGCAGIAGVNLPDGGKHG
jgi:hypothetical protein